MKTARSRFPRLKGLPAIMTLVLCAASPVLSQQLSPQLRPFERGVFNLERFAEKSDVIVHGIVSSKEVRFVDQAIYTHYDLVVQETIQGQAQSNVTVAVLGGEIGNVGLAVPDAPRMAIGDEVVLFGQAFAGQGSFKPVGFGAGLVSVKPGSGSGNAPTVKPRGRPENLDEFLEEVRSKRGRR
jgi:hypothetical protein